MITLYNATKPCGTDVIARACWTGSIRRTTSVMTTRDTQIVNMMRRRVIDFDRGTVVRDQARGVYE